MAAVGHKRTFAQNEKTPPGVTKRGCVLVPPCAGTWEATGIKLLFWPKNELAAGDLHPYRFRPTQLHLYYSQGCYGNISMAAKKISEAKIPARANQSGVVF